MRAYLDTKILVAASVQGHPHHFPAFALVESVKTGSIRGCVSTHSLAEYYSVLTRTPFSPRVHPAEAGCVRYSILSSEITGRFLEENVLPSFDVVEILADDYCSVLRSCAAGGLIDGIVFDALHLHCARKSECDRIHTFNVRDFRAIAPKELEDKIMAP